MLIKYHPYRFSSDTLETIATANKIIKQYKGDGYSLTLRQLYYQFVSKDIIKNDYQQYKKLGELMNRARMAGLVSWYSLEDRGRNLISYRETESVEAHVYSAAASYTVNPWDDQENYVEVWIEKEALIDVISRACGRWMTPHFASKGYNSASEQWRAGRRFAEKMNAGKNVHLLHLGDHDPSGIHMTQDNSERLKQFLKVEAPDAKGKFKIHRLALNMPQVEHYKPPHNPAKTTDSRYADYRKKFGKKSWELDALEPTVINRIVNDRIKSLIDHDLWAYSKEREAEGQREIENMWRDR